MKKGIIVVSFGTTYEETRRLCIESIEDRIRQDFSDAYVLRAFTSEIVISRLKKRDNLFIDNTPQALEKMKEKGIKDIYIQPLHIIQGHEYEKILGQVEEFSLNNKEFNIVVGKPLLSSDRDYDRVIEGLDLDQYEEDRIIIYMGHGSDHDADIAYERLETKMRDKGYEKTFIGTVEGSRTMDDILAELKSRSIKKTILKPLMLVAGDHATNDMASDDEDSWRSILESNNIEVEAEIKGLGEIRAIQDIFIDHLRDIY